MIQNLHGGWSVLLMTRRQHGIENKLLVWEGLVKNKANCELVKQALHSFQSYSISGMGKKRELKALKI